MHLLLKPSELLKQTTWDEQKLQSDIPWILMTSHTSSPDFSPQKPAMTASGEGISWIYWELGMVALNRHRWGWGL